jgi:hypothetical protein
MTQREQTEHALVCVKCAAEAPPDARGWRAFLVGVDDELDDEDTRRDALPGVCRAGVRLRRWSSW